MTFFKALKTDSKNEILKFFAYAIFEKLREEIQNSIVRYLPKKIENFDKLIFYEYH